MSNSGKRHAKYLDGKQKLYWDFVEVDKYIYIYIYIYIQSYITESIQVIPLLDYDNEYIEKNPVKEYMI